MTTDLRPLNTVELLDAAWTLLRRNWVQWYAASSVGTVPLALGVILYFQWLGTLVQGTEPQEFYNGTAVWAFAMALGWALNSAARGAVTTMALGQIRGEASSPGRAWRRAVRYWAGGAFIGLTAFSLGWLGSGCLVLGVFLAAGWWVAYPVLLTEERPFVAALRRSWRLTEGYRGKALGLWMLFVALWLIGALNLHLLIQFLVGTAGSFLGTDTSALQPQLQWKNQAYTTFLLVVLFVLLDPLKCAADAVLYLDIRIRREGADLQERLRSLRAASLGVVVILLLTGAPLRASAQVLKLEDYRQRVRALRGQVERAGAPGEIDWKDVGGLRDQLVQLPDGQKMSVSNAWISQRLGSWSTAKDKEAILARLDALDRSLGGVAGGAVPEEKPVDPRSTVQEILAEPEFQPLAERDELKGVVRGLDLSKSKNWWTSFWDWVRKRFFQPPNIKAPRGPSFQAPNLGFLQPLAWVLLGGAVLFLLALIIRWLIERPVKDDGLAVTATQAPPLEASATENALDHTVDEWELFAQQWLGKGDVRQAIRALYLATLVHLHRERRIDYNRALTNWVYVRQFRGETDHKGTLRQLTQMFDEVWYGERAYGEEQYRRFEQGVRSLGTPAPVAGAARG